MEVKRGLGSMSETYKEAHQENVFVEVIVETLETRATMLHLLFLGFHPGGEEAVDAQSLTLLQSEGHSLRIKNNDILYGTSHFN
jgi:hypothetical protein